MPDLLTLLVQIGVIVMAARMVGWVFRKIHQPQVMGEMVAGILLGPSLLGWISPELSNSLFPPESLGFLSSLSQIGLLVFMFLIGLEVDLKSLRGHSRTALVTSQASIIVPFLLGLLLSTYLYPRFSDASVSFTSFALFIGTALSITAFPVLARILTERNLLRTPLGTITIACAAINDVTGWIILAVVVLLVRSGTSSTSVWVTLAGLGTYLFVMLVGVRHVLVRLEALYVKRSALTQDILAFILLMMIASSWVTERLGVHALFGAFFIGTLMPKQDGFIAGVHEKLNDAAVVLLLPIFFAFTGLRTSLGLLNGFDKWLFLVLIVLVAIVGKVGGSALAARFTGMSWREAGALGILMNTRGLVELVMLNIGLDLGIISPALFSMLVLMALITTFMTAPVLEWFYYSRVVPQGYGAAPAFAEGETVFIADLEVSSGDQENPGLIQSM